MQTLLLRLVLGSTVAIALAGCGSGGAVPPPPPPPPPQTVTFTFTDGTPPTAAVQTGSGPFASAALQGNTLTFSLPNGATRFSVAYVCPPIVVSSLSVTNEFVVSATTQDGAAFRASCANLPAPTGNLSGSANASLIAGTSDIWITGVDGMRSPVGTSGLPFNVTLPTGTNDVAVVPVDGSGNALAVKMIRGQTVPGTLNGGSTVILGPGDATSIQSMTVTNLPAGFAAPVAFVDYHNVNGTLIVLYNNGAATQYPSMPAGAVQAGDFYLYDVGASDTATHNSVVAFLQTTTTGGGSFSAVLPQAWSFSGPAPAPFPTFTFNYTGFNGLAGMSQQAFIEWSTGPGNFSSISAVATASFQSGAATVSIPNLTSIPGFLPPATSGTTVSWSADISGGPGPSLAFRLSVQPANGSISLVQNRGNYTEP
jgi:hypothetical protein